jgi:hypothetical protein
MNYSIGSSNVSSDGRTPFEGAKESGTVFTNKATAIAACRDMVRSWTGTSKDGDYAFVVSSTFEDGFTDGSLVYTYPNQAKQ